MLSLTPTRHMQKLARMAGNTTSHPKSGFTLVEVMAAVALFAVVGLVCLESYLTNLTILQKIRAEQTCGMLARQKEAEYLLSPDDFPESGNFDQPYTGYRYNLEISDITLVDSDVADTENLRQYPFKIKRLTVMSSDAAVTIPLDAEPAPQGPGESSEETGSETEK